MSFYFSSLCKVLGVMIVGVYQRKERAVLHGGLVLDLQQHRVHLVADISDVAVPLLQVFVPEVEVDDARFLVDVAVQPLFPDHFRGDFLSPVRRHLEEVAEENLKEIWTDEVPDITLDADQIEQLPTIGRMPKAKAKGCLQGQFAGI